LIIGYDLEEQPKKKKEWADLEEKLLDN